MIFCGDIALPYAGAIKIKGLPEELRKEQWIGNLEGSLVRDGELYENQPGVYNDLDAINELNQQINLVACSLANNHLLDMVNATTTLKGITKLNLKSVGAGCTLQDAQTSLHITDVDGEKYTILSFGWDNIQCIYASDKKQGVNPYTKNNVKRCVLQALKEQWGEVICFFHWDYELEKYPQPYDRNSAMELIDMGVEAVIGCHAHRTQPIEFYKGKPIVYGLGNFLFQQGYFFGGRLKFPKFCEEEYAFEITKDEYKLHYFSFRQQTNSLEYVKSESISENVEFEGKATFSGFDRKAYETFFKDNRVQRKLLPIFHSNENLLSYWMKSEFIKLRGFMINTLTKLNIKSQNREKRQ